MNLLRRAAKTLFVLALIYLFLLGIKTVGGGAKLLGRDFAQHLISTTSNPFIGLFIGILVTVVVQSSSLTTSLVVAFVGSGVLSLPCAIPIIMGANIGTTLTNTIVSFGHISWRQEFKRAFSSATVHDIFNFLTLIILFPLELNFHYLTNLSLWFKGVFEDVGGLEFTSPVKLALSPPLDFLENLFISSFGWSEKLSGVLMIILGVCILFGALMLFMKTLRSIFIGRAEVLIDKYIFRNGIMAMGVGCLITVIVQSSSLTTSIMVPLAGAGILSLERVLPYTLGANVGTTFTALFASLAITGDMRAAALAAALAHLFFNLSGILIFYPIRKIRMIPIILAEKFADKCTGRRYMAVLSVVIIFIVIPSVIILLRELIWR